MTNFEGRSVDEMFSKHMLDEDAQACMLYC